MRDFIREILILILSSVSGLALAPALKPEGKMCIATAMGSPCAQGGVATLGRAQPGADHGVGNPIDLRSGNKYQRETDLPAQDSGLELVRHYNAMDPRNSALGKGWSWSYDTRIYVTGEQLQIIQADGSRLVFNCDRRVCYSSMLTQGNITRHETGWRWAWPTGKQLHFDLQGRLVRLSGEQGADVCIHRHGDATKLSGLIDRITAGQQFLKFIYELHTPGPRVMAVDTPRGMFSYLYDRPESVQHAEITHRLLAVKRPDGMQRLYHYESQWQSRHPYALTGISIRHETTEVRTHSWRYDKKGRADLFVAGPINPHQKYPGIDFAQDISGIKVQRHPSGNIHKLKINEMVWPGLNIEFDRYGRVYSWQMRGLGAEVWSYDASGAAQSNIVKTPKQKKMSRTFADQTVWRWKFDRHQRVVSMQTQQPGRSPSDTRIAWQGLRPVVIAHPQETQILRYTRQAMPMDLLREREVLRPAFENRPAWSYREQFRYNPSGQRIEHALPEGGSLHYWWHENRLLSISWHDKQGQRHRIFDATASGIRHGNGLITSAMKESQGLTDLMVYQPLTRTSLFHQQIRYNPRGAITAEQFRIGSERFARHYRLDPLDRLQPSAFPMARERIQRDVTGLPVRVDDYLLTYNAQRRLQKVRRLSSTTLQLHYAHNATGERIWRDDGEQQTHYLFDQNKLVAQATVSASHTTITRRYVYAHQVPVAVIDHNRDVYMIHTDAVGLPHLLTDMHQKIRWQGHFTPYGELIAEQGDVKMPLRFPGQIEEPLTGWHDNYQRTYDPRWGQYLEPDPLGPMPGESLYGYAQQQPRRYADPLGLMLFAFDGTGNQPSSLTNVWLFSKAYRDGPVHYMPGPAADPGLSETDIKTDTAFAWSGGTRVDRQWERLLNTVAQLKEKNNTVPIDIVGFSRGAALARHFGNRVADHVKDGRFWTHHPLHGVISSCVDLRFLGLFDTVAQFNVLGAGNAAFNLTIAPAWKWVSHAVALHEHRWLFPLTSAAGNTSNVVERAFVGAHADIGGGYLTAQASPGSTPGNLSQVALAWMQWQAQAAGVPVTGKISFTAVTQPIMHDERAVFSRKAQRGDRRVNHADGKKWVNYQADLPLMGQALRQEVEAFIRRPPELSAMGSDVVGLVDMAGYVAWLKDSMGFSW